MDGFVYGELVEIVQLWEESGDPGDYLWQETTNSVPTHVVVFNPDEQFLGTSNIEEDSSWLQLFPGNRTDGGFITIPNPTEWGLNGGYPWPTKTAPNAEAYSVSMFHQLHCLMILKLGLSKSESGSSHEHVMHGHDTEPDHLNHCLDYLRQAVMCTGDLTLERAEVVGGKRTAETDGWGETHLCRDWSSMYNKASAHGLLSDL